MEIRLNDIPETGLDLNPTVESSAWLREFLQVFGTDYQKGPVSLSLTLFRTCDNVLLTGEFTARLHLSCDRCLVDFDRDFHVDLHINMGPEPVREGPGQGEEEELPLEDEDFVFYRGDKIDLSQTVRDAVLLERPMRNLCREGCRGLCTGCGKNLNKGPCSCPPKGGQPQGVDPRWHPLKNL